MPARDHPRHFSPEHRGAAVVAFLNARLADGPVAVADLEAAATAAGLLGQRQKIADARSFKAAKRKLALKSTRRGFGRGSVCYWALPAPPTPVTVPAVPNSDIIAPDQFRAEPVPAVYPEQCGQAKPARFDFEGGPPRARKQRAAGLGQGRCAARSPSTSQRSGASVAAVCARLR
jgi:hypothetical protein